MVFFLLNFVSKIDRIVKIKHGTDAASKYMASDIRLKSYNWMRKKNVFKNPRRILIIYDEASQMANETNFFFRTEIFMCD